MPRRSIASWPCVKSVISAGAQGGLANTKWSAPAPPVMVSEPWPALRVSAPAPPVIALPGKLVAEVSTWPAADVGGGGGGDAAVAPPNTWAEVRPIGDTP